MVSQPSTPPTNYCTILVPVVMFAAVLLNLVALVSPDWVKLKRPYLQQQSIPYKQVGMFLYVDCANETYSDKWMKKCDTRVRKPKETFSVVTMTLLAASSLSLVASFTIYFQCGGKSLKRNFKKRYIFHISLVTIGVPFLMNLAAVILFAISWTSAHGLVVNDGHRATHVVYQLSSCFYIACMSTVGILLSMIFTCCATNKTEGDSDDQFTPIPFFVCLPL